MQWQLPLHIKKPDIPIEYGQRLFLIGSCFTQHIGDELGELKFSVLQNPHGILFGPDAVCRSIHSYINNKLYTAEELFYFQECWHSWDHHSRFSFTSQQDCLAAINESQRQAHDFIQKTDWLIITLGSSFCYKLTEQADKASYALHRPVANCHRAPQQWFSKELMTVEEIVFLLEDCFTAFYKLRPHARILVTVSPVRHIRDGAVENNRSKARLFEALQRLEEKAFPFYYFPAYELVIDVLRDYRFYDIDLVHPNYAATSYVLEQFMQHCVGPGSRQLAEQIKKVVTAMRHRPRQPNTQSHRQFLLQQLDLTRSLQEQFSHIDLSRELAFFKEETLR